MYVNTSPLTVNSYNLKDAISDLRMLRIHLQLVLLSPFKNIKQHVESLIVGYSKILSSPFFAAHKDFTEVPLKQMEEQLTHLRLKNSVTISIEDSIQVKKYFVDYFNALETKMIDKVKSRFIAIPVLPSIPVS